MKTLSQIIQENKDQKVVDNLVVSLFDKDKEVLEWLCELAVRAFQIPDDIRGLAGNYEPQKRRQDFEEYCEKMKARDICQEMNEKLSKIIGERNIKELLDSQRGAKTTEAKYADLLLYIINRCYVKDEKKLKSAWPSNPDKLLKEDVVIEEAYKSPYNSPDYFFQEDKSGFNYYKKLGYKYYNDMNRPSKEDIKKAYGTTSNVTGDPSFGDVDGISFSKLGDNKWQTNSSLAHVIGGTITDDELLQRISKAKQFYIMLRFKEKSDEK